MTELQEVAAALYEQYRAFWPITRIQGKKLLNNLMPEETETIKDGVVDALMAYNKKSSRLNYQSPVNKNHAGQLFFINRTNRMTRVWDRTCRPVPAKDWIKVSEEEYDRFRAETAAMSPAKRKAALGKKP